MKKATDKNNILIYNYVVTFVDLLGQKAAFEQSPKILTPDVNRASLTQTLRQTLGKVQTVHSLFKSFHRSYQNSNPPWLQELSLEKKEEYAKLQGSPVYSQYFSDSIIFYASLVNSEGQINLRSIAEMLSAITICMRVSFAKGIFFRGGIEIGWATVEPKIGIYGNVLNEAYKLESKVAQYPRIVIGDELLKFIELNNQIEKNNAVEKFNTELARRCKLLFCEDTDGRIIIDFLGNGIQNFLSPERTTGHPFQGKFHEYIKDGFEQVASEYEHFKKEKNTKLAFRYQLLMDYYLERLGKIALVENMERPAP